MKFLVPLIFCFCLITVMGQQTVCQQKRDEELEKSRNGLIGNFVPTCDADGNYSQVQCYASTGFCWCSDKNGNKVSESVRGRPNC